MKQKSSKPDLILPSLPDRQKLRAISEWIVEAEETYENLALIELSPDFIEAKHVTIEASLLTGVRLADRGLEYLTCRDLIIEKSDLANTQASNSRVKRCQIIESRLTGLNLSMAYLESVLFERCRSDMANFFQSELIASRFKGCDLSGADFRDSKLSGTVFEDCKLNQAQFYGADLSGVRLVNCSLNSANIGVSDIKGMIMTPSQVLDNSALFARLLDVKVEVND